MSQALYRKYRSKKLSEIVGQDHITLTLASSLESGHISHAYLFTGPRGVGKTSIARILAHEINKLPYDETATHLDIIEIDAASNRGIEEIRDLREKAALAPTSAPYKVYIIDEVHMLTPPAFNALLKTLEEPPKHVVFMLATTELHKLPETIISRTQRFGLRPIDESAMLPHLKMIAKKESIDIDDEALSLIASHARGGFRDAISLLDQVRNHSGHVSRDIVADIIGLPPEHAVMEVLQAVRGNDRATALEATHQLFISGFHPSMVADALIDSSRKLLFSDALDSLEAERILKLMDSLVSSALSVNQRVAVELAVLKSVSSEAIRAPETADKTATQPIKPVSVTSISPTESLPVKPSSKVSDSGKKSDKTVEKPAKSGASDDQWQQVLDTLRGSHNTLYGILRMADADFNEGEATLTLTFQFPFHMKRAAETKHAQIIAKTVKDTTTKDYEIKFEKSTMKPQRAEAKKPEKTDTQPTADPLKDVISVFGNAELI